MWNSLSTVELIKSFLDGSEEIHSFSDLVDGGIVGNSLIALRTSSFCVTTAL